MRVRADGDDACDPAAREGMVAVETTVVSGHGPARPNAAFLAALGAFVYLAVPELHIDGWTRVDAIRPVEVPVAAGCVVTTTTVGASDTLLELGLETYESREVLCGTANHRFWSLDRDDFVEAGKLLIGERLVTPRGVAVLASREAVQGTFAVYNVEVEQRHTYYVGETGVLVHNNGPACPPTGGTAGGDAPSDTGVVIALERPSGVSDAAWQAKLQHLNEGARSGSARVVHRPSMTGAAQREARRSGAISAGDDADHALDLQFGGADDAANIVSTPARVNRSVGAQGRQRLDHSDGTRIREFRSNE